jgi:AraC-like DNA-binding protein
MGVTACGATSIASRSKYPPAPHPSEHQFDWDHGRVLDCLQIVLITAGRGILEMHNGKRHSIGPGRAFALLPGVWHRYRPDAATGWDESWVELRGPVIDNFVGSAITEDTVVRPNALLAGLDVALDAIHNRARSVSPSFDPELSALGLGVLAAWMRAEQSSPAQSHIARAVIEAERYFYEHYTEPISIAQLAKRLGIAYSHFRREFKVRTGYSPWQYVIHLRLSRTQRLLASSDATLEDIASRVGFSSGFHLSSVFKTAFRVSPHHWRRQLSEGQKETKPALRRRRK